MKQLTKIISSIILFSTLFLSPHLTLKASSNTANDKPLTVLITGANRGIGLALAQQFYQNGFHVIATTRKLDKAAALRKMGVQVEQLEITEQTSVNGLRDKLVNQPIDILINNAGIGGHSTRAFKDLDIDKLKNVFEVNSLGALRVIQAFMPNFEQSSKKLVVNISSKMGSIQENTSGGVLGYRASKTALNSFNKSLSIEFAQQGFSFVVLHPGWVRTDMGSSRATYSPQQSAVSLYSVIAELDAEDNGSFLDLHGKTIEW